MKINLGCGRDRRDGYVNVDLRTDAGADYIGDVTALPMPDACAEELLALDILEHFPLVRIQAILSEWRRLLSIGGRLVVRVPNLQALGALIAEDGPHTALYIRNVYGGHRYGPDGVWDTHHTGWTPRTFESLLELVGFQIVSNDREANMTVVAQ